MLPPIAARPGGLSAGKPQYCGGLGPSGAIDAGSNNSNTEPWPTVLLT
jgi:hypothetical protein